MTVYVYLRVSTDEQDIESQMESVKRWLSEKGIGEFKIVKDEGVSGGIPTKKRQGFSYILNEAEDGDIVVVSELTRLGRSLSDVILTLNELTSRGVRIVSVKEGLDSTSDPMQFKVMTTLFALFADLEREFIRKRTMEGLQRAKAQGKRLGRPPLLDESKLITVVELYQKGFSARKIAGILEVSPSTVSRAIRRLREQGILDEQRVVRVNREKLKEVIGSD
ncbi:recombinase family protein [Thermococcus sp. Bubb.Bath]|uniref:recombinase family protein n=1 Tax=Thermococcus sp. Bubb.Bath TaxID=1638242 RepID=UPI00143B679A|nr:recombinase family protein [Thermococcus sp. Bubb.Bath]NJF25362.1 HTH domain-containing protein [Thermococcus sp. Bubb.Bath]